MNRNTWETIEDQYTIDNVKIVPGMRVWNYNYSRELTEDDKDTILHPEPYGNPAEPVWFRTVKGTFDGSRVWVARPW